MNTWFTVASAKQWVYAVIKQGHRLLVSVAVLENPPIDNKARQEGMDTLQMEQYFFIIAVNKAREWLRESRRLVFAMQALAKEFEAQTAYAKEVRDMREHEIEYFNGKGNKQKDFVRAVGIPGTIAADASAAIIDENAYLIGGRLNVQSVISVAKRIYPQIQRILENLPREELL